MFEWCKEDSLSWELSMWGFVLTTRMTSLDDYKLILPQKGYSVRHGSNKYRHIIALWEQHRNRTQNCEENFVVEIKKKSLISWQWSRLILDAQVIWFKSRRLIEVRMLPEEYSECTTTIHVCYENINQDCELHM